MSTSLPNTAALLASTPFLERVKAAMTEYAVSIASETVAVFGDRSRADLARLVVRDPNVAAVVFARLCADDSVISQQSDPVQVADAEIRRVVESRWTPVAKSLTGIST